MGMPNMAMPGAGRGMTMPGMPTMPRPMWVNGFGNRAQTSQRMRHQERDWHWNNWNVQVEKEQHDEAGWNFKVKNMCSRFVESHDLLKTMVSCHAIPPCFQLSRSHFWPFLALSLAEILCGSWWFGTSEHRRYYDLWWFMTRNLEDLLDTPGILRRASLHPFGTLSCPYYCDHNTISLSPPSPRTSFARPWREHRTSIQLT